MSFVKNWGLRIGFLILNDGEAFVLKILLRSNFGTYYSDNLSFEREGQSLEFVCGPANWTDAIQRLQKSFLHWNRN